MLSVISKEDWVRLYGGKDWYSVFHNPEFLAIHAAVYSAKPVHYIFSYKKNIAIALSLFEKDGNLIVPDHFLRSGFWINEEISAITRTRLLMQMLEGLKARYRNIRFNLPLSVKDIRPFIWCGFKFNQLHTYEKILSDKGYHPNINRLLKKSDVEFTTTVQDDKFNEILERHKLDFYKFKIRKDRVKTYLTLLQELRNEGFLTDINFRHNGKVIASNIILLNKPQRTAYIQLINTSPGYYHLGTHAKIYDETFQFLIKEGYEIADLYGADVPGFAMFKEKFNVRLQIYYHVFYNRRKAKAEAVKLKLKTLAKRVFNILVADRYSI